MHRPRRHPEMDVPSMTAVCEEAHARGVLVAAHAQSVEGVRNALLAGVDTIEHGSSMDEETIALYKDNPKSLRGWSAMIPTLQACMPLVKLDQSVTSANDVVHANAVLVLDEMVAGIAAARENDIPIGMGTDSAVTYVTHANTWLELEYLVRFGGFTIAEAVNTATAGNARILGIDDVTGSLEVGKSADVILLDRNPMDALSALRQPRAVIAHGHLIENPVIDRITEIDDQLASI
ncbi:amidohydrolase family protein [Gordonia spumicola]|nr:amidohydrolase family protein [Gordonia spumicola]